MQVQIKIESVCIAIGFPFYISLSFSLGHLVLQHINLLAEFDQCTWQGERFLISPFSAAYKHVFSP